MRRTRFKKGFTVAEALIVVAIIAVLGAVAVIAVVAYMRSMTKLKYDGYAKEIFVAAQNHLSMAESQGYLGRDDFGVEEQYMGPAELDNQSPDGETQPDVDLTALQALLDTGNGAYYFIKSPTYKDVNDDKSVLNLMLPFAAVDETVRSGGCYVVRYHKDSATVLDVFYWQETDNFSHEYDETDYKRFLENRGNKEALKNYDGSVIGYYGGASADAIPYGKKLTAPTVVVTNADKLVVTVTDLNRNNNKSEEENKKLKTTLIMTGVTSGKQKEFQLTTGYRVNENGNYYYDIVLDDITSRDTHFYNQFCLVGLDFIPGEDIILQAVSFNNSELTNIAYSPKYTTNSLFAYNEKGGSANIAYVRHIENLDTDISKVNITDTRLKHVVSEDGTITIKAVQINDFSWSDDTYYKIFGTGELLGEESFVPVVPDDKDYALDYICGTHTISGVVINYEGNAGLFGELDGNDTVYGLKLLDFRVSTKKSGDKDGSAGAFLGELKGGSVNNVIAYNTGKSAAVTIEGTDSSVGGLVGTVTSGSITKCAAALVVRATHGNAGGLIGTVKNVDITACYSGGHTENGAYDSDSFNVTSTDSSAGGLIGEMTGTSENAAKITNCYSTCSVKGTNAGGLVGKITYGNVTNCYSTGLIYVPEDGPGEYDPVGAFIGYSNNTSQTNCWYYEIINEFEEKDKNDKHKGYKYLDPVGRKGNANNVRAFDDFEVESGKTVYANFVGEDRSLAYAYDSDLILLYRGTYTFVTVKQLGAEVNSDLVATHYGDWPAPEVLVINEKTK